MFDRLGSAPPSPPPPGTDRRAQPRRCVMWRATADDAPCGVRDLNESGARIILTPAKALDDVLRLSIPHRRAAYPAAVIWRAGPNVGLKFLGPSGLN